MPLRGESDRVKSLREIDLLKDLDRSHLEQIAKISHESQRQAGECLMRQGEPGAELVLIIEGSARVEIDGKVVEEVGANRVLGEMALLDGQMRTASVIATAPCTLLVVPYFTFWQFVESTPTVQRQLMISLSRRIRSLYRQLAEVSGKDASAYS